MRMREDDVEVRGNTGLGRIGIEFEKYNVRQGRNIDPSARKDRDGKEKEKPVRR